VNAYQYNTLHDVAKLIQEKLLDPQNILDFHAWLHREEPFDDKKHEAQRDTIETAWRDRYAGHEHDAMSQSPVYMQNDRAATMFDAKSCSVEAARADAERFTEAYRADAQFIFSRVQHHFHKETKKGYVPMPRACTSSRDKTKCKHDFPKQKLMNKRMRVVCRGNARHFGLRVVGKRNMLWMPLNRRSCMWQSGTTPGFAAVFRTNTHTAPNYRVPPWQASTTTSSADASAFKSASTRS
jgi:hypothetical protein